MQPLQHIPINKTSTSSTATGKLKSDHCASILRAEVLDISTNHSANFYPLQVHRGIKGVVRDKDTNAGIANAIIEVEDLDHHIRTGLQSYHQSRALGPLTVMRPTDFQVLVSVKCLISLCPSQLTMGTTGGC